MNQNPRCPIKLFEFSQHEGWYWEITVPHALLPSSRIKKFMFDDPELG